MIIERKWVLALTAVTALVACAILPGSALAADAVHKYGDIIAKSNVPMLGYTVSYAVSNTLLTLWGLVIVLLLA